MKTTKLIAFGLLLLLILDYLKVSYQLGEMKKGSHVNYACEELLYKLNNKQYDTK